jgi:lysophospholipase L1-like esterase
MLNSKPPVQIAFILCSGSHFERKVTVKSKIFAFVAALGLMSLGAHAQQESTPWIETFQASPATYSMSLPLPKNLPSKYEYLAFTGPVHGTLRYRFGISAGGSRIQVKLSNELGDTPLKIDGASIALATGEMDAVPGSMKRLTFDGKDSIVLPPGAPALSDPVDLKVGALSELVASVLVTQEIAVQPLGGAALLFSEGDELLSEKFHSTRRISSRPLVTAVLVKPERPTRVVVALGDSITDAVRDTPTVPHGWAAVLASRVSAHADKTPIAVVSAGIGGNRVTNPGWGPAALARLDRDVLSTPGLRYVILLEGINDIGFSGKTVFGAQPDLNVADLITGYQQIAARAHARGIKIFAGTMTPFQGAPYFSEEKEQMREIANAWIRKSSSFDGVIDFEAIVRDPASPNRVKAEYDSGDHLHPNQNGYKAMGEAIDLNLFR